jgi:hypothetical protein
LHQNSRLHQNYKLCTKITSGYELVVLSSTNSEPHDGHTVLLVLDITHLTGC